MTTLHIELETEGFVESTAELVAKVAQRLEGGNLPSDGAWFIRDFTGEIAGQVTITTKGVA